MSLDFTLRKYQELCQNIITAGYSVWTIARYLAAKRPPDLVVLLRHDIDRRISYALQMACLEKELGIQATYYARMTSSVFRPAVLQEIATMGHEIGYHYETLTKSRGNLQQAIALFEKELAQFGQICDIQTISMHGAPLSPHDNRDLWQHYDFHRYGLLGETYLSLDYGRMVYLTDTGRSWSQNRNNLRDKVSGMSVEPDLNSTDDLIAAICDRRFSHVCISTHPERWSQGIGQWLISSVSDLVINRVKQGFILVRGYQSDRYNAFR